MLNEIFEKSLFYYLMFNSIYYFACGIMFCCDCMKYLLSYRIQPNNLDIMDQYKKSLPCVAKNTLLNSIIPIVILGWYDTLYHSKFIMSEFIYDILFMILLTDFFFYSMHRIFHISWLYTRFHKKHHEFTAPIGLSALYTTGVDFIFGNILPVYLPVLICSAHPITVKIWMGITTVNTVFFAHSGLKIADFHDKHHFYFNKNYGSGLYMDKLFDTEYKNN